MRYMYILGLRSASKRRKPVSFDIRREAARLDKYRRQFALLHKYRIENSAELSMLESALQSDIDALVMQRRELYFLKRRGNDVRAELERINLALRPLRQDLRLCRQIEQDMPRIRGHIPSYEKFRPMVETFLRTCIKSVIHTPTFYEFPMEILFYAR